MMGSIESIEIKKMDKKKIIVKVKRANLVD